MLNHSEICLKMVRQGIVTQPYPKKESTPDNTKGFNFLHLGHIQFISCSNLGIVSKNSLILLNCPELRDSTKSSNYLLVESFPL